MKEPALTGTILNLQRLSTEDGPGLRTTVFFKGCPLSCAWCHNPESISREPELHWLENRCIGCRTCEETCPTGALERTSDGLAIHREVCTLCGDCAEACPANALEVLGKVVSVDALVRDLTKDRSYYEKSGGGVTLSGGEPTSQPTFSLELLTALSEQGIRVALDTCGLTSQEILSRFLPGVDLVLFDLKLLDAQRHWDWTGQDNRIILSNLGFLQLWVEKHAGKPAVWIRTPLIPGATDDRQNIQSIGAFLANEYQDMIQRWELCAFNNLCKDKYRRLDKPWDFQGSRLYTKSELIEFENWAKTSGFPADRVFVTGSAQVEEKR